MKNLLLSLFLGAGSLGAQTFMDVNLSASGSVRSFDLAGSYKVPIIDTWNFTLTTGAGVALVTPILSATGPVQIQDPRPLQLTANLGAYLGPFSAHINAGNVYSAAIKVTLWPLTIGAGYQNIYGFNPVYGEYKGTADLILAGRKYDGGCYLDSYGHIITLSGFYTSRQILGFGLNVFFSSGRYY